jgi:hypothetical protein
VKIYRRGVRLKWKPYKAAPARFVDAIKASPGRNLLDELFDPLRLSESPLAGFAPIGAPPMHTADELAALWPMICRGLLGDKRAHPVTPDKLHRELVAAGLPIVRNADAGGQWHVWQGRKRIYFWTVEPVPSLYLTEAKFRQIMQESFDRKG